MRQLIKILSLSFSLVAAHCLHAMMAEVAQKTVNVEDITKKMIEEYGPADPDYLQYLRETVATYPEKLRDIQRVFPRYEVAGGIDYFMTPEEMRRAVTEKFGDMYREGNIMTTKQFNALDQSKWYKISDPDLTRIWGAHYLSKQFEMARNRRLLSYQSLKTPRYIIVVEDLSHILVEIHWGQCYPIVAQLLNGVIYAEKIEGERVKAEGIGFGFTDPRLGNSLRTKDNIEYVVDTEHKSFFDNLHSQYLQRMKFKAADHDVFCPFLKARFELINGIDFSKPYVIHVKMRKPEFQ